MNTTQANAISLSGLLSKLGHMPQRERGRDLFYLSPLREEETPSFHVNAADNIWYDFGEGSGGDVVDFACAWLESRNLGNSVPEALHFLRDLKTFAPAQQAFNARAKAEAPALQVVDVRCLRHPGLLRYLSEERMIPLDLARKHVAEVEVLNRNTGKTFHAVGMKNADGGYELRNKLFKGCVGRKDVSVIRGAKFPVHEAHVFEGFMDLLSALADQEVELFAGDMIVLHSLSCLSKSLPYIEHYESYRRLFSWLDNDAAGEKAARFLQGVAEREEYLTYCAMNATYAPFKDVNESRVSRLSAGMRERKLSGIWDAACRRGGSSTGPQSRSCRVPTPAVRFR